MDATSQVRRRIGCNDRVGYGPRSPVLEENTSAVCCLSATDDESVDTGIATDPAAAVRIIRRSVEDDDVASVTVHDRLMQGVVPFVQIRFPCTEAAVDFDTVVIDHIRLALRRHIVPFGHPDTVALRSQAKRLIDRRESIRPVRSVTASATYVPVDKVSEVLFVKHQIHHEGRVTHHFVSPRTGCGREMKRDLFLSGRVPNYLRTGRYRCRWGSALESPLDAQGRHVEHRLIHLDAELLRNPDLGRFVRLALDGGIPFQVKDPTRIGQCLKFLVHFQNIHTRYACF